jgi:hypothetical protein
MVQLPLDAKDASSSKFPDLFWGTSSLLTNEYQGHYLLG